MCIYIYIYTYTSKTHMYTHINLLYDICISRGDGEGVLPYDFQVDCERGAFKLQP